MFERQPAFITRGFLRSIWARDFDAFKNSNEEAALLERLTNWSNRVVRGESADESALMRSLFQAVWGYRDTGGAEDHTLYPQHPVPGAGPRGGTGSADAGLGLFEHAGVPPVMQVACEFKPFGTDLDAPQRGRGDQRSPVEQCLNYLHLANRSIHGAEPVRPRWGIVTDMNEFRLYWYDRGPSQFLQFNIRRTGLFDGLDMLADGEEARFERFLFQRLFHADTLLTSGGKPLLEQLINRSWVRARDLEKTFYGEYRAYREHLYQALVEANPNFGGTRGRLVRLAQKLLDRAIFIFYCEDMGRAIGFPPQLLRDFLIEQSRSQYLDADGTTVWQHMCQLFRAMNDGSAFGDHNINQFNGGLFARDEELENLSVPNRLFCIRGQGHNEASLYQNKLTLLYLSASYNYAADLAQGLSATEPERTDDEAKAAADARKADPDTALGLYTLGHIFEQSITELEILEAEAEGRVSVNKESKRKTNGVYYTPEWVVERIVREALGDRLTSIKRECGWTVDAFGNASTDDADAIDAYRNRLQNVRVLDPACGSGAFLITALKYLLTDWRVTQELRRRVTGDVMARDEDELIRDVLRDNLYGVDINPASVEITRLALWLHTARGDRPLSSLEEHIRDGNSLIDDRFWRGDVRLDLGDAEDRERINTFDWRENFPEVFDGSETEGFDVVLGNPPYVKLQNFRKAHPEMADYLRNGRADSGFDGFASAKSGNFDLYLPFIEKGIELLKPGGRLGYIAPSVWVMNKYGAGLRDLIANQRSLDRWLDFRSHQIFEEATVYTALQFFRKPEAEQTPDHIMVAAAPDGIVPDEPWIGNDAALSWDRLSYGDRWLMLSGAERDLIDRLDRDCARLGDSEVSEAVFVGLQTSADTIYHLKRIAPGRYRSAASDGAEVRLEDAIMHPLISGAEAKRYVEPSTDTYILFPYQRRGDGMALIPADEMTTRFPLAWDYLRSHEDDLRVRESGGFDDDEWYRFGRTQNLDKQDIVKLLVPRLVANLKASLDDGAEFYLDNVDVGGISPSEGYPPEFLLAIVNGTVGNFVFRRISKPFRGDYLSANKQFIEPLPVPRLSGEDRTKIGQAALALQDVYTRQADVMARLAHRLASTPSRSRRMDWLFPSIPGANQRSEDAPGSVDDPGRWAKMQYEQDIEAECVRLEEALHPDVDLEAEFASGELRLLADRALIIHGIFLDDEEGQFIAAQWNAAVADYTPPSRNPGKALATAPRKLIVSDNAALRRQVIELSTEASDLKTQIADGEDAMEELLAAAYALTDQERRLVSMG